MTRWRGHTGTGVAGGLSRLILMLALALFGAHASDAGRAVTNAGPIAANETVFAPIILTAQIQLMRVQLPEGDTPHAATPAPEGPASTQTTAARVSWEQAASLSPFAIHILPPVRGPPAV